jgi:hypothetical protein
MSGLCRKRSTQETTPRPTLTHPSTTKVIPRVYLPK